MTIAEDRWLDAICSLGCVVCLLRKNPDTPAEPHHLLKGGRQISEMHTIPLCAGHHRVEENNGKICRHPWLAKFEAEYGTEQFLLHATIEIVKARGDTLTGRLVTMFPDESLVS